MPLIRKEGKDTIIFATKEDHATPSKIDLPEPEPSPGLILPNGEINWNCPCLGGMATGPCGLEFREAFSCFHYSTADPKGSDCYEAFKSMQTCMTEYPALYGSKDVALKDDEEESNAIDDQEQMPSTESTGKRRESSPLEDQFTSNKEGKVDAPSENKAVERADVK